MSHYARLKLADGRIAFAELRQDGAWLLDGTPWGGAQTTDEHIADVEAQIADGRLRRLCPVTPSKIVCIGRNYREHAEELGNAVPDDPLLFFKPPSALLEPDGTIELPPTSLCKRVDHEVELGVVIGRRLRRVTPQEAGTSIFGLTIVCDVTARDLQKKDKQWTRAKGFDTFCPVGPVVATDLDPCGLELRCDVNGERRQWGNTVQMVWPSAELIAHISQAMTLEPGDLIATGTPAGVSQLHDGDRIQMCIEGIGELSLSVTAQ